GRERVRLEGHQGPVSTVAFAPDGKQLATGSNDTTVLVWDLTGVRKDPVSARPLSPAALDALWADLAGEDAARAYRAVTALRAAAGPSVPFLRERLRPAVIDLHRISGIIVSLDHDRAAVRQQAMRELEQLHELAEPALRRALDQKPSLESRRRIEQLLARCER